MPANGYQQYVQRYAKQYGVPPALVNAVIRQESGGNANARSPVGAQGLMQLMPGTAAGLGVKNPFNVQQNIMGGTKYLSQMLNQFGGDQRKALAAYNAGPGNVQKYGGIPPFKETQQYVNRVLGFMKEQGGGMSTPALRNAAASRRVGPVGAIGSMGDMAGSRRATAAASIFRDSPIIQQALLHKAARLAQQNMPNVGTGVGKKGLANLPNQAYAPPGTGIKGSGKAAQLLRVAQSQVGTLTGEAMKYIRAAGGTGQEPWCGDFVQWVFKQNGIKPPPARSVPALLNWAQGNGRFAKRGRAGDMVMFDWNKDGVPDHVGLVKSSGRNGIQTIEGNTSGARGTGVWNKSRRVGDILGYVRS